MDGLSMTPHQRRLAEEALTHYRQIIRLERIAYFAPYSCFGGQVIDRFGDTLVTRTWSRSYELLDSEGRQYLCELLNSLCAHHLMTS